jgi:hypothetical protein
VADAQHLGIQRVEARASGFEGAQLMRSPRRVVLRVEGEHDTLVAAQGREVEGLSLRIG